MQYCITYSRLAKSSNDRVPDRHEYPFLYVSEREGLSRFVNESQGIQDDGHPSDA